MTLLLLTWAATAQDTIPPAPGWQWKDTLTLVGIIITAVGSVYAVQLSRRTTLDTSETSAALRGEKITQGQFDRLQTEISSLRAEGDRREQRHERELEQRDERIDELEERLVRSERRVEQLVQYIRDEGRPVPPPLRPSQA